MNEVLRMSRKALIISLAVATLAWGVLATAVFAPLTTHAAGCTSGTLIKGSLPAVYYCGGDGKRYVFPNEKTYNTWYSDFSSVTTLSDADLASVQIGGNVTYRPGVKMVKITTDPKVYAVSLNGALRPIADEAAAVALYGSDWNTMIDDVPDAFFTNYSIGSAVSSASDYDKTAEMSASQSINEDKALTSGSATVGGVSKASDFPAGATLPLGAMGVNFLKFMVSNSGSSSMTVDSVTLHRSGPGAVADISSVYLYEGAERLTTGRSVNSTTNEVNFTGLGLELAPGASRTLWVSVDVASGGTAGDVHAMSVTKVMSGGSNLAGTPVDGANFTLAGATVGSLTIAKTGTITNPKVGEKDVKIAEFQVSAGSSEDVRLERLTLFQGGNLSSANLTNLKLKQAGNTVATATGFNSKLRATFDIVGGFALDKGQNKTFQVYADIGGTARSGDTLKIYVEESSDVYGVGQTYGHGTTVTRTAYDGDSCTSSSGDCSYSSVEAGQVTVNFLGPASADVATNANDLEVYRFTLTAQSNVEVRNLRLSLTASDLDDNGGGNSVYTDVKVTNVADGSVWWGPQDAGPTGTTDAMVFADVQTLTAGTVYEFSVTLDTESGIDTNDTATMTLSAFQSSDIRNLDNSTFLTPSTDVVPSGALAGNQMTVKTPSLTTSLGATPVSDTFIKGSSGIDMLGVNLKAGDSADITVTAITVTGWMDEDGSANALTQGYDSAGNGVSVADDILSCKLMDGSTQVGTAESPTASSAEGSGGLLQFTGLTYVVPSSQTKSLKVNCDISNSAFRDSDAESVAFSVQAAGDITAQDPDGNAVTPTGTANGSGTTVNHEIANAGSMSYALAPDDTESEAGLVIAGQSNVVLAKVRLTALNEELKQTKMRWTLSTAANYTNVVSMSLYDGSTLVAGPVPVTSSGNADFSGFSFVVPKDGSKTLTVKAVLNSISGGAASGKDLKVTTDLSSPTAGTFEYRGTSSSTVVTTISSTDVTGRTKILRKTKPTVSLASLPTTTLTDGSKTLARVTVTADSAEQVSLKAINWTIAKTVGVGLAASSQSSVREVGQGSNITGTNLISDNLGTTTTCAAGGDTDCLVKSSFTSEQVIPAGTSKTYELVMTVSSVASSDSVSTNILTDTDLVTGELEDTTDAAAYVDGELVDDLDGTNATAAAYNFVWSDNSAIPHTDGVDGTAGADDAAFSNDWTNGLYVKVLPSDAQTLTAL